MNYRHRLQYLLVKKTGISNKEAALAILDGKVSVNQEPVFQNCFIGPYQKVQYNGMLIQSPEGYKYFVYHKPKGVECTLNPTVEASLLHHLPAEHQDLFYAGRLDKNSEGLLLLINDGNAYNKIIEPAREIEKVYEVQLEKKHNELFLTEMRKGVKILNTQTKPCQVEAMGPYGFSIILTQGMNRQIRRMCFALSNYVTALKRTQIGPIVLGELPPEGFRSLTNEEIDWIRHL